jgi:hypothetical protein
MQVTHYDNAIFAFIYYNCIIYFVDIKECDDKTINKCAHTCTEKDGGGFTCSCKTGHYLDNDGYACKGKIQFPLISHIWALFISTEVKLN